VQDCFSTFGVLLALPHNGEYEKMQLLMNNFSRRLFEWVENGIVEN
jgi:hypothetical protein